MPMVPARLIKIDNSSGKKVLQGSESVDVIQPQSYIGATGFLTLDLSDIDIKRINLDTVQLVIPTPLNGPSSKFTLKGFDASVDIIRTSDGDFTLQEIFDHGNNAPFYKQAKINLEVQQEAVQKKPAQQKR